MKRAFLSLIIIYQIFFLATAVLPAGSTAVPVGGMISVFLLAIYRMKYVAWVFEIGKSTKHIRAVEYPWAFIALPTVIAGYRVGNSLPEFGGDGLYFTAGVAFLGLFFFWALAEGIKRLRV